MYAKFFIALWLGLQGFLYIATAQAESPPTADAGKDLIGIINQTITLNGSASFDPDGDSLTYEWTIVSAPKNNAATLVTADKASPNITPAIEGVYTFSLKVSTGDLSSSDQMSVYVKVPTNEGMLLEGNPDSPAIDYMKHYLSKSAGGPVIEDGLITNRLFATFDFETATVSSLNAALESVGARISTMLDRLPMIEIAIPAVSSVGEAEIFAQQLLNTGVFYYVAPQFWADPTASPEP